MVHMGADYTRIKKSPQPAASVRCARVTSIANMFVVMTGLVETLLAIHEKREDGIMLSTH